VAESDKNLLSTIGDYQEENIVTLEWQEHIRRRPGMYIGKLGDGSSYDDGIYVLLKEVLDNSIDEFMMGFGKTIEVKIEGTNVSVRDYGRGVPLGKVKEYFFQMNTRRSTTRRLSRNRWGSTVSASKPLTRFRRVFLFESYRDGRSSCVEYERGIVVREETSDASSESNGTLVSFTPDPEIFDGYAYREQFIEPLLKNYVFLNTGLTIVFNGKKYTSKNGLEDLLNENLTSENLYPIIHLYGEDIEVAITHTNQYGEEYYAFVNGQHTTQGGTHLSAFREASARTIKEFFNRNFEYSDIRNGIVAAISIKVEEPVFESQTKTKLGSKDMSPNGVSVNKYIGDFLKKSSTTICTKIPKRPIFFRKRFSIRKRNAKPLQA